MKQKSAPYLPWMFSLLLLAPVTSAAGQVSLQIDGPTNGDVVTSPVVTFRVTCTSAEPGGCVELRLCLLYPPECYDLQDGVPIQLDTSAHGSQPQVSVSARNVSGTQSASLSRSFYVETGPLREVLRLPAGTFLGFDGSRLLMSGTDGARFIVTTGGETIPFPAATVAAALGPGGAILLVLEAAGARVVRWNGSFVDTGIVLPGVSGGAIAGDWLAYRWLAPATPWRSLTVVDLRSGQTVYTFDGQANVQDVVAFQLAEDGDIIFTTNAGTYWRQDGVLTRVGTGTGLVEMSIKTDGVHATSADPRLSSTWLYRGNTREQLCQGWEDPICGPVWLNGGWVGYSNFVDPRSTTSQVRLYRRSPLDVTELLDTLDSGFVSAVSPQGEVIAGNDTGRFLYRTAGQPIQVSPRHGSVIWAAGWYALLGQTLYELVPFDSSGPLPDGGVDEDGGVDVDGGADAGPIDAGPDDAALSDAGDADLGDASGDDAGEPDAGVPDAGAAADAGDDDGHHHGWGHKWPHHFRWPRHLHGCALSPSASPDVSLWLLALVLVAARRRMRR